MPSERISIKAKSIAVIGAGPSGAIAAKYLRSENAFSKITLFEQRSRPGGIWNYTGAQRDENIFTVPQIDPNIGVQEPEWQTGEEAGHGNGTATNGDPSPNGVNGNTEKVPSFLSPMYEKLETNIPRGLMGFQDLDWPSNSQLFPTHETVLKYIEDYTADVSHLIRHCTQVTSLIPTSSTSPTTSWTVSSKNLLSGTQEDEEYDAVIIANGHFIVPFIPEIDGLKEWNKAHPGLISHSKYYRHPSDFQGKKVIVIGNSASGSDISAQISQVCAPPLLWSTRSQSLFSTTHGTSDASDGKTKRKEVPPIKKFIPQDRSVEFSNGHIERDIDAIILATGYFYSLPFLSLPPSPSLPAPCTTGERINSTYQHLFYTPLPTLSFLALPQRVIPFPLAEAQAAVLSRVYSNRLTLPPILEMSAWQGTVEQEMGSGRSFHLLPFPKDAKYINAMASWALSAPRKEGLESGGRGKVPPVWGEWEFWCRERFPEIRRRFGELGERRRAVRSVGELGFDFEAWRGEKEREKEGWGKGDGEKIV